YQERLTGEGCYVLNVGKTHAGLVEGSVFVRNLRDVRPFEAYFTVDGGAVKADFFSVFDKTTDIADLFGNDVKDNHANEAVYDLGGRRISISAASFKPSSHPKGVYIVNGRKRQVK
ncbi:MAG: hypothetical protein J6W75_13395, partial [Bacteroidaceae bacterium]|nr:hypothetical protein [Bacteroidaceae bacterium]